MAYAWNLTKKASILSDSKNPFSRALVFWLQATETGSNQKKIKMKITLTCPLPATSALPMAVN